MVVEVVVLVLIAVVVVAAAAVVVAVVVSTIGTIAQIFSLEIVPFLRRIAANTQTLMS